jgi:diguanylate cyclase (GGDEF)-like protein
MAVIMADLDHFKDVNDTYGHQAGDTVLQETARRMVSSCRAYDFVGRYGGEEFLVVVPTTELEAAAELAERLRQSVSAQPINVAGAAISATLSLGVAVLASGSDQSACLLRQADEALYAAKKAGRNRVESALNAEPAMPPHA